VRATGYPGAVVAKGMNLQPIAEQVEFNFLLCK
jgi:hypothetical protein